MSRICVKNLPKHVDDKMLREHFSAKGEVTDAKLMRTKEGKTRQFAFIGFRTEDQAHEAIRYFNQTFINTCRISCELARQVGDPEIPRPWSRHTKEKEKEKKENENKKKSAFGGVALKGHGGDEEDEKLMEFLEVMQPRTKSKLWTNDTVVVAAGGEKIAKEGRRVKKEMEEEQAPAEMEVEESVEKNDEHNVAKDEVVSDMEYFKSRVKKEWSDSESSDSDDDQEEEKEDNEKEEEEGEKLDVKVQPEVGELIKGVESVFGELDGQVLEECDPSTASKDEKELEGVDTCRLFVRNLPYTATENELEDHFSRFGEAQVHLVIDKEINRSKGIAFVHYTHQESAQRALEELDDSIFQGRLLHVMPAKQKNPSAKTGADDSANQAPKSLKQQREEKKKAAEAGGDTRSWNSLFIRPETAVDIIARKYGVSKSEFLDADDVAVRVAQAQTQVIALSKKGLTKAGINVESLENLVARKDADMKRSNHIILVKNLPDGSSESELSNMFGKFGTLDRVIMPSTKTFALIVFFEPSGARAAFKGLHYKKYKDVPLYLEWAPANILSPSSTAEKNNVDAAVDDVKKVVLEQFAEGIPDDLDPDRVESRTLYVKNLNFKTSDEVLKKHFSEQMNEGRILSAKVKKHLKNGKNVSMGFGFVEFDSVETAKNVCKDLQETILDGHVLKLQHTRAKQDVVPKKVVKDRSSTKLIVRNVAFEATEKELRKLFSTYGEIKSLRLPKRLEQHRGFAFVEFATKQEAQNAIQALASSHLYLRHLVLEMAKEGESLEDLRARAGAQIANDQNAVSRKRKAAANLDEGNMKFERCE